MGHLMVAAAAVGSSWRSLSLLSWRSRIVRNLQPARHTATAAGLQVGGAGGEEVEELCSSSSSSGSNDSSGSNGSNDYQHSSQSTCQLTVQPKRAACL